MFSPLVKRLAAFFIDPVRQLESPRIFRAPANPPGKAAVDLIQEEVVYKRELGPQEKIIYSSTTVRI